MKERDAKTTRIRCAIYTRKSSEEGLEQEFNSLDAQRESAEAYIASMKHEGWVCLPNRYDDGGYTGGNMERPAVKQLMADIDAGQVDAVVVYKVDRLSRSLMDFARMMQTFEKRKVSFVSVTQQFNTTHSMGRLTLNILLSFAQFEREIISERTRDKIAAARRKGMWSGGRPVLGYDLSKGRLSVNRIEAIRVREIFGLYLANRSLSRTIEHLDGRGWTTKVWQSAGAKPMGGRRFDKAALHKLLTNVLYVGKVRHHRDVFKGEHEAIVEEGVWDAVQRLLRANRVAGGTEARGAVESLLKGLVSCSACRCRMVHTWTRRGSLTYRYYVCHTAAAQGRSRCKTPRLPAGDLEDLVAAQVRDHLISPALVGSVLDRMRSASLLRLAEIEDEVRVQQLRQRQAERDLKSAQEPGTLAFLHEARDRAVNAIAAYERETHQLHRTIASRARVEQDLVGGGSRTDDLWSALSPTERGRLMHLVVKSVAYDGKRGEIDIEFHDGIAANPTTEAA